MKIAIITPHYHPVVRGNAVTVHRIKQNLITAGLDVAVFSLDALSVEDVCREIIQFCPDMIHAFHGYAGGRVALTLKKQYGFAYVITLTGSDVYEALLDDRRKETTAALSAASHVAVFHESVKYRLLQQLPALARATVVIPQGVALPAKPCAGSGGFPFTRGKFTFLLPAGLRPVKNVLFPLGPLATLLCRYPHVRLILAGPVLDSAYATTVMRSLERYSFAHYIGGISHDQMGCLYNKSDVVLNTSLFEGGMANSVLEALAYGKPVLAADIEGNSSLIVDGETGFLYDDERTFLMKAEKLVCEPETCRQLGETGQNLVRQEFAQERELAAYLRLYQGTLV